MVQKGVAGGAGKTTVASAMTDVSTTFTVADATGYPTGRPFVVFLGARFAGEAGTPEKILVGSRTGNLFQSVTRGYDGTLAVAHDVGEGVRHVLDALSVQEFIDHIYDTTLDQHTQYLNNARHDLAARHTIGTVIASAAPTAITPGNAQAEGAANSVSRSDHVHATPAYGLVAAVAASAPGDAAAAGASTSFARVDHKHARESTTTLANSILPPGMVVPFAGSVAPSLWAFCDGASYARAAQPNLYAAIGLAFTATNDGVNFNVPDLRGSFPLGKDNMGGTSANRVVATQADNVGQRSGGETHQLTQAEMPVHTHIQNAHDHGISDPGHRHGVNGAAATDLNIAVKWGAASRGLHITGEEKTTFTSLDPSGTGISVGAQTATNQNAGSGAAHNNMPPYLTMNYLIKL